MRLIIDNHIPYISSVFEPFADVAYLPHVAFTREAVAAADVLVVRTRVRCDAKLLEGSRVRMIATATIGTDHIDLDYCAKHAIEVVNAPGCNAASVAQYIASALSFWSAQREQPLAGKTIGVVGVGNVGTKVVKLAEMLGMTALCCDPLRQEQEHLSDFVSLDTIAEQADIITFHTPLTRTGQYATYHMADAAFFDRLKRCPLIINSARGDILDAEALMAALDARRISDYILDCWPGEPLLSAPLLDRSLLMTPHIAGYSADGKATATRMVVDAIAKRYGFGDLTIDTRLSAKQHFRVRPEELPALFLKTYPIAEDADRLRAQPDQSEMLRNNYPKRREIDVELI